MAVTVFITTTCECCGKRVATKTLRYPTAADLVDHPRRFQKETWSILSNPRGEALPAVYCMDCGAVEHRQHPTNPVFGTAHVQST